MCYLDSNSPKIRDHFLNSSEYYTIDTLEMGSIPENEIWGWSISDEPESKDSCNCQGDAD